MNKRGHVGRARALGFRFIARKVEHGADHGVHFGNGRQHSFALAGVLDIFGAQPQQGKRRAQIMRNGGKQSRAVFDEPAQALLHGVERARRVARFRRAGFGQRRRVQIPAESLGCRRQCAKWRSNAAHRPRRCRKPGVEPFW
nr:hypothetical protein [Neorhizobium vignae]